MSEQFDSRFPVKIQEGVEQYLGHVVIDYDAGSQLLEEAFASINALPNLVVNINKQLPRTPFRHRRYLGIFRPSEENIYLNAPLIKKHGNDLKGTEKLCNRVLLHEVGHAVDACSNGLRVPSHPGRSLAALLSFWGAGTALPTWFVSTEAKSNITVVGAGLLSFIGSGALGGYALEKLDKRGLTADSQNEAYAEAFEKEYFERFPRIIQLGNNWH